MVMPTYVRVPGLLIRRYNHATDYETVLANLHTIVIHGADPLYDPARDKRLARLSALCPDSIQVAVLNGRIVGQVFIDLVAHWPVLSGLGVLEDDRGQGIGTNLMLTALDLA